MLFSKPKKSIGVDIGSHSVKAVQMSKSGGRLKVEQAGYAKIDRNQFNADPIGAQATSLREALRTMPIAQSIITGALPGQTVVIRYPRLPDMDKAKIAEAVEREASQSIPYELSEVFLDWSLLDTVTEGDKAMLRVLLVAAKHEVIESRVQIAEAADVHYSILGVDSLALADAAEVCDLLSVGESVALINLGAATTSIHFIKDGQSNFIRDVSWGGKELIQAIAKARRCDQDEAEKLLFKGEPKAPPPPAHEEAVEVKPEDVSPLGGGLLEPLADELGALDETPVSSKPSLSGIGGMGIGSDANRSITEILAQPLTRLVTEIRRSFDYYEQQLYEHPVSRLILSGGVAQLPLVAETLREDLDIERVDLADPANSGLGLGADFSVNALREQSPQFMVAVGLAARGAWEL